MTRNEQQRIAFVEHKSAVARNMKDLLCKSKDDVAFWNKDCYRVFYSKENKKSLLQTGLEQLKAAKAYNEVSSIYKKFLNTIYKEHDKVFIEIATEYAVSVKNEEATARKFYNSMVSSDKSARELFAETSTKYVYKLQLPNGLIAKVDLRDEAKINSITKKSRRNYNETK